MTYHFKKSEQSLVPTKKKMPVWRILLSIVFFVVTVFTLVLAMYLKEINTALFILSLIVFVLSLTGMMRFIGKLAKVDWDKYDPPRS
jgi:VIT1/CCC1 family predicted Fe2+/Mn2+ transporter